MSFSLSARSQSSRSGLNRAFTLLEIMVVLAILGLLATVLLRKVTGDLTRGEAKSAELFVRSTLSVPLTAYRIDMGTYPLTAQGLDALINRPSSGSDGWKGPYYETTGGKLPVDPWKQNYEYRYPGTKNKSSYDLFSKGPDMTAGTDDDIGNW